MDLHSAFLTATFPERSTILQLPLVDYSLGHDMLLRRLGSPFLGGEKKNDIELIPHLFSNLFICSLPWKEALEQSTSDRKLAKQFVKWQWRVRKENFHEAIAKFLLYIAAGCTMPPFEKVKRKGYSARIAGSPFHARLLLVLMRDCGMTFDDALSTPMGLAQWLYCSHWETEGRITIKQKTPKLIADALAKFGMRRLKVVDAPERN